MGTERAERFTTVVRIDDRGRTHVPVPFEPDETWGTKPRHHVTGTLNGLGLRGVIDRTAHGPELVLGPAWCRDAQLTTGDRADVVLGPEGPQRSDLAADVAAALDAAPDAGAFFDSLAQFYRNAYLRWIDATKRRPEQRPVRIAEVVRLLQEGQKERPKR
ncbi:YdeI/OmpD-associated family protein [Myceligenerans halotolerans]